MGRVIIIFNPHFNIADIRQGYVIRKANQLNFASSFRSVGHRVSFGTYILTLLIEFLILVAGVLAIALLGAVMGSIGYGVSKIASYSNYRLFILVFCAPAVPLLVLYLLVTLLIFSPTAYILVNNDGISAGEIIGACYRSMINNGKMTVFLSYFISLTIRLLYFGVLGVGGYFLFTRLVPQNYLTVSIIGFAIASFIVYLTFAPILTLANRVVKDYLFEDILLDPVTAARINEKVNISVCNGKKVKVDSENLASLFDYTEDPYRILEKTERKSQRFAVDTVKEKKLKPGSGATDGGKPVETSEPQEETKPEETTAVPEDSSHKPTEAPADSSSKPTEVPADDFPKPTDTPDDDWPE